MGAKMRKERTVRKVTSLSSKGARGALLRRKAMALTREKRMTATATALTTLSSKRARRALLRRFLMTPRELKTTITKTGLPWLIEGGSGGEHDEQGEKDEQEEEGARRDDTVT